MEEVVCRINREKDVSFSQFGFALKTTTEILTNYLARRSYLQESEELTGTSINCHERFEGEADGAQKPECTRKYMRISSTAQRSNRIAQ